jgi:beta-lactamase superfamily II metal-dependent hydrolase
VICRRNGVKFGNGNNVGREVMINIVRHRGVKKLDEIILHNGHP